MLKLRFRILLAVAALFSTASCSEDCEPSALPVDDVIYLNVVKPGGGSYIKYTGNNLPADSVRITNLATGASVARFLLRDSVLAIETYDRANNAVTNLKIEIGAPGLRKPDTLQVTAARKTVTDNCARDFEVTRFGSLKMNLNTTLCTDCAYNQVYNFTKP